VILSAALIALGLGLWIGLPTTGPWAILRVLALAVVTAGLYIALRWCFRRYVYTLEQHEDGHIDLAVTEQNGRRQITVCRVSTAEMESLVPAPQKLPAGPRYHYYNSPRPRDAFLLTLCEAHGGARILFTPDGTMQKLLFSLLPRENGENFS
jgi:hypothetical protein